MAGRSLRPGAGDEWLFWEQYTQEPNVAISSFLRKHRKLTDEAPYSLMPRKRRERPALTLMEIHLLAARAFWSPDSFTAADAALFTYTHVAEEGGFSLSHLPVDPKVDRPDRSGSRFQGNGWRLNATWPFRWLRINGLDMLSS